LQIDAVATDIGVEEREGLLKRESIGNKFKHGIGTLSQCIFFPFASIMTGK